MTRLTRNPEIPPPPPPCPNCDRYATLVDLLRRLREAEAARDSLIISIGRSLILFGGAVVISLIGWALS